MNRKQNRIIWIKGLVMQCPHGTPLQDCPLNGLRDLPIREANRIINNLEDSQINNYVKVHRKCYQRRLGQHSS